MNKIAKQSLTLVWNMQANNVWYIIFELRLHILL